MKILSFIIATFIFLSCSSEVDESKLFLFNDTYFQLEDGELTNELTKENTDLYFSLLGNPDLQAPLYKYIKSDKYDLFIGIPVETTFAEIKKSFTKGSIHTGELENSSNPFVYTNYNDDGKNITKYLVQIQNDLVLLLLFSDSSEVISQAKLESISQRLSIN